jgi:teichoic acid transport system permease protein
VENNGQISARGQISAPGSLEAGAVIAPDAPKVPDQDLGELAAQYGLKLSGARPSLHQYIVTLWQRRHFIVGYATARNVSMYTEAKLGQVWQVLTPILNACVYYLIFGLLFETARAVQHFPAFLVVGVFVFAFTERSIVTGSNVMRANIQLIRALYFPRASLPLAYVIVELQQMLVGMVVVTIVMLVSGQYPSWYWLLLIPAVILQTMFNTGAALIVARMGGAVADVSELIPFILRIARYFCGVMYLIFTVTASFPAWVGQVLSLNPIAVYISLVRVAFMSSYRTASAGNQPFNATACGMFSTVVNGHKTAGNPGAPLSATQVAQLAHQGITSLNGVPIKVGMSNDGLQAFCHAIVTNNDLWIAGALWGVVIFLIGIVFFWQAESVYGRG